MKKIYFLLVFFGALLFCACEKENTDLLLEDQSATQFEDGMLKGAMKHAVPFKARFENYELPDEEPPPPDPDADLRVFVHGTGYATHLGKTAIWHDQKWIFDYPVSNEGWGTMILTAANGDELWAEYTNSHGFDTFPLFIMTGEGEFNGGTGRFEDATGPFILEETWHLFDAVGGTEIIGEIRY